MKKFLIVLSITLSSCSLTPEKAFLERIKGDYLINKTTKILVVAENGSMTIPNNVPIEFIEARFTVSAIYKTRNQPEVYLGIQLDSDNTLYRTKSTFKTIDEVSFKSLSILGKKQ